MELQAHEKRVVEERNQLQEKADKLKEFFTNPIFNSLKEKDRLLLYDQMEVMNKYLSILNERIGRFIKV